MAEVLVDPSLSLPELAAARRPQACKHTANPANAQAYEDAYGRYRLLFDSLDPMF